MAAIFSEAAEVLRDIIARDHVEHHIGALAPRVRQHRLDKIGLAVIDREIGADTRGGIAFRLVAAGHDHLHPEGLGEHDRHRADAAGAAVDQHALAIAREAALEQVVPHGEQGFGQSGGFGQQHPLGHGQAVLPMHHAIFGIASARGERGDTLPDHLARDFTANRDDLARNFKPEQRRSARRRRIGAGALQAIGAIDPGIGDADQHIIGAQARQWQRLDPQHLRPAGRIEADCLHAFRQVCSARSNHLHPL